jgi:seipin
VLVGVSFLFATATILYSLVYYLVIPSRLHEQDIFFDYGNHAALTRDGLDKLTLPSAKLSLLDPVHQWEPSPLVKLPVQPRSVLVPGVKYDIFIELTMPESRANVDIGMFMVSTTLKSLENELLATSTRSAIVHDSHSLVRWIRVGALALSHAFGFTEPSQQIHILAINGITESKVHPLTSVSITLNHPEVQIYSAKLTIIAQLSGVRYLMYHWSVSTAVLVILNIVFLETTALVILFAFYNLPVVAEEETLRTDMGLVDQGQLFEQHRSGGIPPIHVERKMKTEPIESSTLIDEADASAECQLKEENEEMRLRYRSTTSGETED